jgi:hypothetical protein
MPGGKGKGPGKGKGKGNEERINDIFDSAQELIKRSGIEIGDRVVVIIQGGPIIFGTLVAAFDRVIRVRTTADAEEIPVGTLLTIRLDDIAAIGRVPQS